MAIKTSRPNKTVSKSIIISKKILTERIADKISKKINLNHKQIEAVLSEYLEESKQALVNGQEIRLVGFYSFKTVTQKERVAMNLQTKQKMNIPAKQVPKITFSKDLKEAIAKSTETKKK
jgi:DNA-binding protein HU-beta